MKFSVSKIAIKYLKLCNYKIDEKTFELQIETHPEYPSIKSISDTFDYFKVDNLAVKVPRESLEQLPKLFISLFRIEKYYELVLTERKKNYVIITDKNLNRHKLSFNQFKENWEGTILAIEENIIDENNSIKYNLINLYILPFIAIFLVNLSNYNEIGVVVYNLFSLFGFILSYFIVKEALGIHNKTVSKVCESISKSNGCNGVINNKKSLFFNSISLSDASIVYFSINILSFLFVGFNQTILFSISLGSVPVVLFAIYYQGAVLKQWCILCLGVSTVLIVQFLTLSLMFESFTFNISFLLKYLYVVFFVLLFWKIIKELWVKNLKLSLLEIDFLKFKRNKDLFTTMLNKQKLINNNLINKDYKITFGSKNPFIVIDAVTNPYCGYCSESFKVYYNLLTTNKNVQINFVFSVPNDITSIEMQVAVTILNIYFSDGEEQALQALNDWYIEREIDKWKKKYDLATNINDEIFSILKIQNDWLIENDITQTPATIIDGCFFPKLYNIEDLLLFIDDMLLDKQNTIL